MGKTFKKVLKISDSALTDDEKVDTHMRKCMGLKKNISHKQSQVFNDWKIPEISSEKQSDDLHCYRTVNARQSPQRWNELFDWGMQRIGWNKLLNY